MINQIPYHALKTKREITIYRHSQQYTKGTRGKPNEQLFPRQLVIQLPKYVTHIIGEPKYKYGQQEQVTVRNHNRRTALERSVLKSNEYLWPKRIITETSPYKINPRFAPNI